MKNILLLLSILTTTILNAQVFNADWQWANGASSAYNVVQGSSGSSGRNNATITVDEKGNTYVIHNIFYNDITINTSTQGEIDTLGNSSTELLLSKYNCNGNLDWFHIIGTKYQTSFGNINNFGGDILNTIGDGEFIYDNQGSLFFSIYPSVFSSDSLALLDSTYYLNPNNTKQLLIKVDTNGSVQNVFTKLNVDSTLVSYIGYAATDDGDLFFIGEAWNQISTISPDGITPGAKSVIGKINKQSGSYDWLIQLPPQTKILLYCLHNL